MSFTRTWVYHITTYVIKESYVTNHYAMKAYVTH
jgi:hypothetical protein